MAAGYTNFYQNFPIHPHNRFHGGSVPSAYSRNSASSWSSANTTTNSGIAPQPRQLKNVRRIEPGQILSDYRQGYPSGQKRKDHLSAPIYATKPKISPYDGKAAYEAIKNRIQETQRKRGNLIEGQQRPIAKVPSVRKPKMPDLSRPKKPMSSASSSAKGVKVSQISASSKAPPPEPKPSVALKPANFKIAIDAAAPPNIRSKQTKPAPNGNNDWSTNYNDDFKNWPVFNKQLTKTKAGEIAKQEQPALTPSTTILSQTSNANNEKRKLMERLRREKEKELANTERALEVNKKGASPRNSSPRSGENKENGKLEKPKHSISRYQKVQDPRKFSSETTNSSTYQRWPKSAFQTVGSRNSEKPVWANPANSTHFPRKKVLKDSTKHNMNITLCVDGKSMGSKSIPKTTNTNPSQRKRSVFQTEYMRTYQPLVQ